nr:PIG-L family deacetylase [Sphingomonas liriopis]
MALRRPRRALIVAPHPDDEVIGAAGLIQLLRRRGTRVGVAIVSDGAASHPGSLRWPRPRLIAARRRESLRALRRLGIPAGDVAFLGLPDSRLSDGVPSGTLRRLTRGIDLIVGPAASDAHPDHQAVAAALHRLPGRARRLTYQVWPPRTAIGARARTLVVPGGTAAKRSLIRLHATQLGMIRDDPAGFAIAAHELAAFAHPIETFVELRR